jgi:uncharacterized protein (DUF2249 family)
MLPLNQFTKCDVRALLQKGIEPFPVVRQAVDTLPPGKGLLLIAPFLPSPLIEKLGSEGFESKVERGSGGDWIVYFWKAQGTSAV